MEEEQMLKMEGRMFRMDDRITGDHDGWMDIQSGWRNGRCTGWMNGLIFRIDEWMDG